MSIITGCFQTDSNKRRPRAVSKQIPWSCCCRRALPPIRWRTWLDFSTPAFCLSLKLYKYISWCAYVCLSYSILTILMQRHASLHRNLITLTFLCQNYLLIQQQFFWLNTATIVLIAIFFLTISLKQNWGAWSKTHVIVDISYAGHNMWRGRFHCISYECNTEIEKPNQDLWHWLH